MEGTEQASLNAALHLQKLTKNYQTLLTQKWKELEKALNVCTEYEKKLQQKSTADTLITLMATGGELPLEKMAFLVNTLAYESLHGKVIKEKSEDQKFLEEIRQEVVADL